MTHPLSEAEAVVEQARAQLDACPCGCNREATAHLFDTLPDEELLFDVADLFMEHGLCVADIASTIGATQSAVSHQLRTLKQARLVRPQRDGKNVIYSLSDDHVFTMLAQAMTHVCE